MRVKSVYMGISIRIFLVVQWLRFYAPSAVHLGSIPSQGTKIPHTAQVA